MKKHSQRTPKPPPTGSPVHVVRGIGRLVELVLYVRAGGRCEFDGCNKAVLENPLTLTMGNFGEKAHIVAFSDSGPRGQDGRRPNDINSLPNLMLLCPICHLEIDRHPERYPRAVLEKYKEEHEGRIALVTSSSPDRKTTIVQLKARIGGKQVAIPPPDVFAAVAPMFPEDANGFMIDVSEFDDRDPHFLDLAARRVDEVLRPLQESRLVGQPARHVSVFAFGPIPLLMYLGSRLSDKLHVEFFQFHRDTKDWTWKEAGPPAEFALRLLRSGTDPSQVALLLSLSGTVRQEALPSAIDGRFFVYELALVSQQPSLMFLNTRADLIAFRRAYLGVFSTFEKNHPPLGTVHFFPAIPLPVAVMCGHDLLNKAHPSLLVYDLDKAHGGYTPRLTINAT